VFSAVKSLYPLRATKSIVSNARQGSAGFVAKSLGRISNGIISIAVESVGIRM